MNHLIPSVLLLLVLFSCKGSDIYQLASPDGRLSVKIEQTTDSGLMYRFFIDNKLVIGSSPLGYRLDGGRMLPDMQYKIVNNDYVAVNSEWHPVWGKRSVVPDVYNQLTLEFESKKDSARFVLDVRLYDDGFAFRYNIPEIGEEVCADEVTGFNYVENPVAWFYNGEDANYGPVRLTEVDTVRSPNITLQLSDDLFLNMHEACLMQGDPLMLDSEKGEHSLVVASSAGVLGKLKSGYTSAWRVVMVGNTPGALVDSHLLELLNPDPDMDFSWVKPGIAVWDWRINGAEYNKFTYTMSYPSWVRMVDFAAEQGFGYLVLDANWYGPEFDSDSNPTNGHKAADVQRLLAYAKEKGVGVWLYLNDIGGRKFPIEETLSQYGRWGASGVKYGFMEGSPEEKNRWTQKITELCAKNRLLVDFHDGPVHPYGQMRTWPNAVTREYCHAQLDAHRVFTPSTFCTSVFVNMVAGPLDMNNGMFDLRQGPTTRIDENQPVPSTLVSEAARTLIVFSGVTILPDIPEYYKKYPVLLQFLSAQKMPWKESRTLAGKIGEYVVMMRQTDEAILVGAATNESGRIIDIPLDFLDDLQYDVLIIEDGDGAHYLTNRETLKESRRKVSKQDSIKLTLAPGGGACLIFKPVTSK